MSTMEAPVATMASTMLYLIMSAYSFMQPPALVLPARVRMIVQSLSSIIFLRMSAALAVSLAVKLILAMALMIGVALKEAMSICSMVSLRRSFFFMGIYLVFVAKDFVDEFCRKKIRGFVGRVGAKLNNI